MSLVSVIIPTYKRPDTLGRAIESVLKQTYAEIEIIVVDDNDEKSLYRKETSDFMERYSPNPQVIYLHHKNNKGASAARNTGIAHSKAKYIAFLDDDDEFLPRKIEKQLTLIEQRDNSWGAVYSNFSRKTGGEINYISSNTAEGNLVLDLFLRKTDFAAGSTLLIKRYILEELNGFDETFTRHEEWGLLVQFFRKYKIACASETLVICHMDSSINRPTLSELEKVNDHFFTTFDTDLRKHPETFATIHNKHYLDVVVAYLHARQYKEARRVLKDCYPLRLRQHVRLALATISSQINKC